MVWQRSAETGHGPKLSLLCCEKGSSWDECYAGEYGAEIQDGVIRRYYESEIIKPRLPRYANMSHIPGLLGYRDLDFQAQNHRLP